MNRRHKWAKRSREKQQCTECGVTKERTGAAIEWVWPNGDVRLYDPNKSPPCPGMVVPKKAPSDDPLKDLPASLLIKLGSCIVHADELLSPQGHEFDRSAFISVLADPEVQAWLASMERLALVPLKRDR